MSQQDQSGPSCDCEDFSFGDYVRSIQNPHLTGQIIGERNWGTEYHVRLADGASSIWWHYVEIEHDEDAYPSPAKSEDKPLGDNVIKVDFTKPRTLRPSDDTEGAA
ncbi:hypothetical protein [Sinorhizobium meliloti]|uniref:hypothetical protein n=1 Tax=Rhizobium meliloti TaxID=382 RepID=UPI000FD834FA|nr:hypothetical protein [Sinorhizobium meliloti]RVI59929.1 hypothetical protein CN189_23715 [Sinorhizobium meliloti]